MRVSGERSSCEALASSDLCELHQRLDALGGGVEAVATGSATSSCPSSATRTDRSPSPQRSHAALQGFEPLA